MKIQIFILFVLCFHTANLRAQYFDAEESHQKFKVKQKLLQKENALGKMQWTVNWQDKLGKNHLKFEQTGAIKIPGKNRSAYISAKHFVNDKLVRTIKDSELKCAFDLNASFIEKSLTLTDLDNDGIAEIAFLYTTSCRSDVSPAGMKLILLEENQKYALRGHKADPSIFRNPKENIVLKKKEQKNYKIGPMLKKNKVKLFLNFAQSRWLKFSSEDKFKQFH